MIVIVAPAAAMAQDPTLAELAKTVQVRRKAFKDPPKVYSNKNLPETAALPATPAPPTTSATPGAGPADSKPAAQGAAGEEQKDETWWRKRMTQARELLRRNEVLAEALQSRTNALSNEAVSRDDPYQPGKMADDRQKTATELQRVKGEIEQSKKEIADIEEEARRAGALPGWLR